MQHRPALGDRVVAEPVLLHRAGRRDVCAKCSAWPASWKSARQSSGPPIGWITSMTRPGTSIGEQKARGRLVRPLLDVEVDVLLRAQVDAEVGERRLERREHLLLRECGVPLRRAEQRGRRPSAAPRRGRPRAARGRAGRPPPRTASRSSRGSARHWSAGSSSAEAEAPVELDVARRAERAGRPRASTADASSVERVELLVGQLAARRARAARAVRGRARSRSPAAACGTGSSRRRPRPRARPRARRASRRAARELAEVALARRSARARARARRRPPRRRCARACSSVRQVGVALVDRLELERLLVARRSGGSTPRRAPR